jgi:hemerythrin-like domain-containing protein
VQQIIGQHEQLIRQGQAFLEQIEAIEESAIVRRDHFVEAGRAYLNTLGQHMGIEEKSLFPLAADALTAEGWLRIERGFERTPDPLFGPAVEQRYRNLLTRIHC